MGAARGARPRSGYFCNHPRCCRNPAEIYLIQIGLISPTGLKMRRTLILFFLVLAMPLNTAMAAERWEALPPTPAPVPGLQTGHGCATPQHQVTRAGRGWRP